ncbi:ZYBA0S10-04258g1_1 [Zygosaccharomyces bailii CLIB 213]|uniref:Mitochondrial import inner membrane translocase subunit n=1 Tax=Zygosaccharomyces bailii (strain CLIB 213 / ATCC 58445 / CBS 680 / BCRC 21525 / NBRC 1098 / NCYC 1416 / NRRL Y-2227) TaxID=1333698 RepID=A0A8J2XDH9_ZYGB2|nr:ZYBA0S10-04258g1_1 [Zygosaccharomyces bailii CLIB 213]
MSSISITDLASLNDSSKKEIATFLEAENSKQKVQMSIHQFTNTCFRECVQPVNNGDLSSQEEQCLSNCVNRFLDTNIRIVKGLQGLQ